MWRPILHSLSIFCLAIAAAAPAPGDDAASARQIFDSLFGPKLKQVASTIDRADDLTLAKDMLGVAKSSTNSPALLAMLCEAAHDLGVKHADGYATAAEAMSLLAETVAEKRAAARDKLVLVLTKQSTAGKPDERDAAGEQLIDTLLAIGDEKMEAKKWPDAAGDYRKAVAAASTRKSAKLEPAKASLDAAMYRDRTEKQAARLQEKILKDATDAASAEELVRLYLLELDDAAAAKRFLDRVKDEKLRTLTHLAAKAATELASTECLELGEWLAANAEKTPAQAKHSVLHRAEVLLERFLIIHVADDGARIKAQVRLKDVKKWLASAAAPAPAPKPKPSAPDKPSDKWVDVLALVDLTRDTVAGEWKKTDTGIKPVKSECANLVVPCKPRGSYQILVKFTLTDGPVYDIHFPAGKGFGRLMLGNGSHEKLRWQLSGLRCVNGKDYEANVTTTKEQILAGKTHTCLITVQLKGQDVDVNVRMNDKDFMQWKGPQTSLIYSFENWMLPDPGTLGLGGLWAGVEFHELKVRMLDGKLEILRPAK